MRKINNSGFIELIIGEFEQVSFARKSPPPPSLPQSQQLLRNTLPLEDQCCHVVSNEFDWFKQPIDARSCEIFAGVGTNNVWDLAVRRNAKMMILIDRFELPHLFHEYFLKPLVMISDTPAEFISHAAGVPIPDSLRRADISAVFDYISTKLARYPRFEDYVPSECIKKIKQTSRIVSKLPNLQEGCADFVKQQLRHALGVLLYARREPTSPLDSKFGVDLSFHYIHLHDRYCPEQLIAAGADSRIVRDERFSVLSSQESFSCLKGLIASNNVFYVNASIYDPETWKVIAETGAKKGYRLGGAFLSNVLDCNSGFLEEEASRLNVVLDQLLHFPSLQAGSTIYMTRGKGYRHEYFQIPFESGSDRRKLCQDLGLYSTEPQVLLRPEDFLAALWGEKPKLVELRTDQGIISFGNKLAIFFRLNFGSQPAYESDVIRDLQATIASLNFEKHFVFEALSNKEAQFLAAFTLGLLGEFSDGKKLFKYYGLDREIVIGSLRDLATELNLKSPLLDKLLVPPR